jgi:hypothetical protein
LQGHVYARTRIVVSAYAPGYIVGEARCKAFQFAPVLPQDLPDDLAVRDLVVKLAEVREGKRQSFGAKDLSEVEKRLRAWPNYASEP